MHASFFNLRRHHLHDVARGGQGHHRCLAPIEQRPVGFGDGLVGILLHVANILFSKCPADRLRLLPWFRPPIFDLLCHAHVYVFFFTTQTHSPVRQKVRDSPQRPVHKSVSVYPYPRHGNPCPTFPSISRLGNRLPFLCTRAMLNRSVRFRFDVWKSLHTALKFVRIRWGNVSPASILVVCSAGRDGSKQVLLPAGEPPARGRL